MATPMDIDDQKMDRTDVFLLSFMTRIYVARSSPITLKLLQRFFNVIDEQFTQSSQGILSWIANNGSAEDIKELISAYVANAGAGAGSLAETFMISIWELTFGPQAVV